MELTFAYLYPKLLNIYGDRGNVLTLLRRCEARGIKLQISTFEVGENIHGEFDIYFIGGGQDEQQILVSEDLQKKQEILKKAVENNSVFLAICGGYQLLGKYYKDHSGREIKGIEAIDLYTVAGEKRMIGNVVLKELESNQTIVGFENHSGKTFLGKAISPLGKIVQGSGNNGEDGFEGVRYKNIFGTYLHGSLLPKNPYLADKIISLALKKKGYNLDLALLDDTLELLAHKKALSLKY